MVAMKKVLMENEKEGVRKLYTCRVKFNAGPLTNDQCISCWASRICFALVCRSKVKPEKPIFISWGRGHKCFTNVVCIVDLLHTFVTLYICDYMYVSYKLNLNIEYIWHSRKTDPSL